MGWRHGPIETLSDAVQARRLLWILCQACGHATRFDPRNLMALRGPLKLRELRAQFKCQRCGKRRAAVVLHDEEWAGRD